MSFRFAIIGGGLTGTSMLCQLVEAVGERIRLGCWRAGSLEVLIFERQDVFGPGLPHNDRYVMPYHITNMCSHDMGILHSEPDGFQKWVKAHRDRLQRVLPLDDPLSGEPPGGEARCRHYPRAVMGEYLKAMFQDSLKAADEAGIPVRLFAGVEVTDLRQDPAEVHVTARRSSTGEAFGVSVHRVLLATGHWFAEPRHRSYFSSPWPARKLLEEIPEKASVGVLGTSLSAVETALTLTSEGKFQRARGGELFYLPGAHPRRISLYSRRGLFPRVRGRTGTYRNRHLTREGLEGIRLAHKGRLTLGHVFRLLEADLEAAYGRPFDWREAVDPAGGPIDRLRRYLREAREGDGPGGEVLWQTVLHQSFSMAREIYLSLAHDDRKRFDREYTTLFFMHAATQPAINAEKTLALMEAGIVTVQRLGDEYEFSRDGASGDFVFRFRDESGQERTARHPYVVDARGQPTSVETHPSELYRNLRESGTILTGEPRTQETIAPTATVPGADEQERVHSPGVGSVRIDPATHRILTTGNGGATVRSRSIHAVGAMTRGQIIDTSMAHGIARSTATIARDVVDSASARPG